MFGKKDHVVGEAVIVENHIKHHGGGDGLGNLHEWVADVRPETGEPFRAVIQTPGLALDFREPDVGDIVSVHIDPKSGHVSFDKSDPRLSLKAAEAARQARFEHAADGAYGSGGVSTMNTSATSVTVDGVHVVSGTEAMPLLQSLFGDDVTARGAAISELRHHAADLSAADRLAQLEKLRDAGVLTGDEYATQRQRIIGTI